MDTIDNIKITVTPTPVHEDKKVSQAKKSNQDNDSHERMDSANQETKAPSFAEQLKAHVKKSTEAEDSNTGNDSLDKPVTQSVADNAVTDNVKDGISVDKVDELLSGNNLPDSYNQIVNLLLSQGVLKGNSDESSALTTDIGTTDVGTVNNDNLGSFLSNLLNTTDDKKIDNTQNQLFASLFANKEVENQKELLANPLSANPLLNLINTINDKSIEGSSSQLITNMLTSTKDNNKDILSQLQSLYKGSPLSQNLSQSASTPLIPDSMNTFQQALNQDGKNPLQQFLSLQSQVSLQQQAPGQDKAIDGFQFNLNKMVSNASLTEKSAASAEQAKTSQLKLTTELNISTPVMSKNWGSEFNNHMSVIAKDGGGKAIIKLNPAHLGPVEATIKIVNDVATIQVTATHAATRDAIDSNASRLRDILQEQGFSQVDVDVSGQGFSQKSKNQNEGSSQANGQLAEGDMKDDFSGEGSNTPITENSVINGVVDYYT